MRNATYSLLAGLLFTAYGCTAATTTPSATDTTTSPSTCATCNLEDTQLDFATAPTIRENPDFSTSRTEDFAYAEPRDMARAAPLDLAKTKQPEDMAQAGGGGDPGDPGNGYAPPATCWSYSFLEYFEQDECEQSSSGIWYQCSDAGTWVGVYDDGTGNYYGPDGYCSDYTSFY